MGRPHSPIDPDGPLADFANGLRAMKVAKKLTYREMADRVSFCVSVLSMAASGKSLPTLEVALAYVHACDGSASDWQTRWEDARRRIHRDCDQGDDHA